MNKLRFYQWATWLLLLLNIFILCFFALSIPKRIENVMLSQSAKQEMNLTTEQHRLFNESAEKHKKQMKALEDEQYILWQAYFHTLPTNDTKATNDSIILQLQKIEKQKIAITYTHFNEIKAFLKPEQYKGFSRFLQRLLERTFRKKKIMTTEGFISSDCLNCINKYK